MLRLGLSGQGLPSYLHEEEEEKAVDDAGKLEHTHDPLGWSGDDDNDDNYDPEVDSVWNDALHGKSSM